MIPFFRPTLGEEEVAEVVDTLRSGWLTAGPKVRLFEQRFAERVGAEAAFATTSCTAALHLALLTHGIGPGDEVITTGFTFVATVNVIVQVGARPVLVDVEPDSLNLDPDLVRAAITPRTRAVIPVHYAGHPAPLTDLAGIAADHGLHLIDDAAHAVGATHHGRPIGGLGNLTAFSFYANKIITTGEGGMLTGPAVLIDRARLLGRHGIDRDLWTRREGRGTAWYDVTAPGLKYGMDDIHAALGLHQLDRLDDFLRRRHHIAMIYNSAFADLPGVRTPTTRPHITHAWHLYTLRLTTPTALTALTALTRDDLITHLTHHHIGTALQFRALSREPCYRGHGRHPQADRAAEVSLSLPLHPGLGDADVASVIAAVRVAVLPAPTRLRPPVRPMTPSVSAEE